MTGLQTFNVRMIDEISCLSRAEWQALEELCRTAKGNGLPWGGITLITLGDWRQMLPIGAGEDSYSL